MYHGYLYRKLPPLYHTRQIENLKKTKKKPVLNLLFGLNSGKNTSFEPFPVGRNSTTFYVYRTFKKNLILTKKTHLQPYKNV